MFRLRRKRPSVERVYAIGDVHGRFDLFKKLLGLIERDHVARGDIPARIVLLGDIVDRGPWSASMVKLCMKLTISSERFKVLKGNHEAAMVDALRGDLTALEFWLRFGGRETLASWGLDEAFIDHAPRHELMLAAGRQIGRTTLEWLDDLPLWDRHDGYFFVHAGIRPGRPFKRQKPQDLLWIREEFLASEADHGAIVVHGHTIHEDGPDIRPNRIGIDTGAYRTGCLTALVVEAGVVRFLSTSDRLLREF